MVKIRKLLYISFIIPLVIFGQEKNNPKEHNAKVEEPVIFKDSLPKISLPDFVITGQEKIDISNRNKIEISEDNLYEIPLNQNINFELKDISTTQVETPFKKFNNLNNSGDMFSGFIKGEAGNFNSLSLSAGSTYEWQIYKIGFIGNYISRGENVSNSDYYLANSNLFFVANIPETDNIFNNTRIGLNLYYNIKNYKFYGVPDYLFYLRETPNSNLLTKKYSLFKINPVIISNDEKYFKYKAEIIYNYFKDDNSLSNNFDPYFNIPDYSENSFYFNVSGEYQYKGYFLRGKLLIGNNNLSPSNNTGEISKNAFLFNTSFNAMKNISDNISIEGGLKFYSYQNLKDYSYIAYLDNKTKNILLPYISFKYENNKNLSISLNYSPDLEIMSLYKSYIRHPYLYVFNLEHIVNKVNLYLNFDYFFSTNLRIKSTLGYLEEENTPIYRQHYDEPIMIWSQYQLSELTKCFYAKLDFNYNINDNNRFELKLNYQRKRLHSETIPYSPDITASLDYYTRLYFGLFLNPSIEFIGKRKADDPYYLFSSTTPLPFEKIESINLKEIFLFNINLEYNIINNVIASVNIRDIFNSRYSYYKGYEEFPFSIFAGIKFKW